MDDITCGPIVEMLGDGMAAILWERIKDKLILPYVDIDLKTFDLSLTSRDLTENEVILEACEALKMYNVGVKCATKSADSRCVPKYNLHSEYISPNVILRNTLGGTVIREPIEFAHACPRIQYWKKPITILYLGEMDQYESIEFEIPGEGRLELIFTPSNSNEVIKHTIYEFKEKGIALSIYCTDEAITNFAHTSFHYALFKGIPLYFSVCDHILRIYDGHFRNIFDNVYKSHYKEKFKEKGIQYIYKHVTEMAKIELRSDGGYAWAMKIHDGDLKSSFITCAYGMMSSIFICYDGRTIIAETYMGTPSLVSTKFVDGEVPGFDPSQFIIAWAKSLQHRSKIEKNSALYKFSEMLEKANLLAIDLGFVTQDLATMSENISACIIVNGFEFIEKVSEILHSQLTTIRSSYSFTMST